MAKKYSITKNKKSEELDSDFWTRWSNKNDDSQSIYGSMPRLDITRQLDGALYQPEIPAAGQMMNTSQYNSPGDINDNINLQSMDYQKMNPIGLKSVGDSDISRDLINPKTYTQEEIAAKENELYPDGTNSDGNNLNYKNILGEAARYSPAAISGARALFGDFSAEDVNYGRYAPATQVNPEQISKNSYNGLFDSQYNKLRGDINNASGGSGAAARASLQGASINNARSKADMINKIVEYNLGQKSQANYYNAGNADKVNQMNTQMAMQEQIANQQNEAAAEDAEYQAWNDFIGSLSGIGTQLSREKSAGLMTPNVGK